MNLILRRLYLGVLPGLLLLITTVSQAQTFDRDAMLENLAYNIILPSHESFLEAAANLESTVNELKQEPNEDSLEAAQKSWRNAIIKWQSSNLFALGDLQIMILHNQISKGINSQLIEENILMTNTINASFIEDQGSSVKGLLALEYLLFNEAGNTAVLNSLDEKHSAYLVAVAENLHAKAQELYLYWSPEDGNYAETFISASDDGSNVQSSLNKLANQMMAYTEKLTNWRLARPLVYHNSSTPHLGLIEGELSESAVAQIRANLNILLLTFTGAQGLGFDDYLDAVSADYGAIPLSKQMTESIYSALDALESVDKPLATMITEKPERVEQVYNASKNLLIMTGVDMANQLGITVTFSDNDGD